MDCSQPSEEHVHNEWGGGVLNIAPVCLCQTGRVSASRASRLFLDTPKQMTAPKKADATAPTRSQLGLRLRCTPPASKEAPDAQKTVEKGGEKVNTEAFLDEYQPVMMSGRALNRLEACAVQQAPNSHPVSRSDQKRHNAAAQSELTPPGKSKVMPARIDCFVRAEIVQIPGNGCHLRSLSSSHGLTCGRSDCEINSTARLTQICRLVGEKTQLQRVNLQLNAYADKLRATEAKLFLFFKKKNHQLTGVIMFTERKVLTEQIQ